SDDAVGSHQKFTRRFAEGIGKLAGNVKGDHREEDRRTCRKIVGGCRSMRDPYLGRVDNKKGRLLYKSIALRCAWRERLCRDLWSIVTTFAIWIITREEDI
ncbi:hypothetical protein BHM03_00056516, partial [Ensete ventricosum]